MDHAGLVVHEINIRYTMWHVLCNDLYYSSVISIIIVFSMALLVLTSVRKSSLESSKFINLLLVIDGNLNTLHTYL